VTGQAAPVPVADQFKKETSMSKEEVLVEQLGEALFNTLEAFSDQHDDLTAGGMLDALFGVLMQVAEACPDYSPGTFRIEMMCRLYEATNLEGT
jgi:hypothetical protein